jgi:hypothetical protein
MPKRLLDRCQPDSIREFRAAARQRFDDGLALSVAGQRTGAIYLWGYTAEMTLRAAYLSFIGLGETTPITQKEHLRPAVNQGRLLGVAWPPQGEFHNVRAWAELLVTQRASTPDAAYSPSFGGDVQRYGQRIGELWREFLRYHRNYAYAFEVRQVREAAEWFLVNSHAL